MGQSEPHIRTLRNGEITRSGSGTRSRRTAEGEQLIASTGVRGLTQRRLEQLLAGKEILAGAAITERNLLNA
jgi:hypothetical protein